MPAVQRKKDEVVKHFNSISEYLMTAELRKASTYRIKSPVISKEETERLELSEKVDKRRSCFIIENPEDKEGLKATG